MTTPVDPLELALKAPVTQANLRTHVFVCTGGSCGKNDSEETLERFRQCLAERGMLYGKRGSMSGSVIVTSCGSVGLCSVGPAVLIYPDAVWYYGVKPADVDEIVERHLVQGQVVSRLLAMQWPSPSA